MTTAPSITAADWQQIQTAYETLREAQEGSVIRVDRVEMWRHGDSVYVQIHDAADAVRPQPSSRGDSPPPAAPVASARVGAESSS